MPKLLKILIAIAVLPIPFAASPASATSTDDPPAGKITIDIATINGSGCKAGTTATAVARDKTAFTVTYSDYLAQAGGSSDPIDMRKNCQLNLIINVPQGYTFAIAKADYRGFAHLQSGANGLQKASYYFQGMSETTSSEHTINGPYSNNWQYSDVGRLFYRPCDEARNLNVNTELRAYVGTSDPAKTSFMAMDSTDGSVNTRFHFSWKRC